MIAVDILDAKTQFYYLVEAVASGREREIVIVRHGCPVAKLVPLDAPVRRVRLGLAKGLFEVPDDIDCHNDAVAALFGLRGS